MAASRCRSLAKPSFSLLRSTFTKPATRTSPKPSLLNSRPSVASQSFGSAPQLGCLQSLLPLYSAVSSARLTSCLGIDATSSRSMCQGMLCSANPGVCKHYFHYMHNIGHFCYCFPEHSSCPELGLSVPR